MGVAPRIEEFLAARVAAGDFPGASYLVAEGDRILAEGAVGHAVLEPERIAATPSTIYDLASLTKPLATAVSLAQCQSEGRLRLDDPLARHLPAWSGAPEDRLGITLLDLLTHRSGLPAWKPLYLYASDRRSRIDWLARAPLACPPGKEVVYSDLGYMLLGFALEAVAGSPLDRIFVERVARRLGTSDLFFRPKRPVQRRIAATETGNQRERDLAGPDGEGYNGWRTGVIWGEVHDGNAHTLGGAAGHAGLFGTARAVLAAAAEFLGGRRGVVPVEEGDLFRRSFTPGLAEERAVGFQMASTSGSSAGGALSSGSFGHAGFTGTSLWVDPGSRRVYILLTNRVHPRFREMNMNAIRRDFHEVAAAL
ncbi:MAG TPA: serine hydrolase [Candidatus Polarisedimenticolia bacterium]|nr:serine hydrolase [Candidatus Polarisedimenticolia bacterium]